MHAEGLRWRLERLLSLRSQLFAEIALDQNDLLESALRSHYALRSRQYLVLHNPLSIFPF
jgi:hypothetical protein